MMEHDDQPIDEQSAREFYDSIAPSSDPREIEKAEIRAIALERIDTFWLRGLRLIAVQKGVRCLSFDCYLLAIGHGKIIGIHSAKEVAKIYKVTRQAATECVDDIQKALKLEAMPGQRSEEGRQNMATARKGQVQ